MNEFQFIVIDNKSKYVILESYSKCVLRNYVIYKTHKNLIIKLYNI